MSKLVMTVVGNGLLVAGFSLCCAATEGRLMTAMLAIAACSSACVVVLIAILTLSGR